jgi:hypothetical protein
VSLDASLAAPELLTSTATAAAMTFYEEASLWHPLPHTKTHSTLCLTWPCCVTQDHAASYQCVLCCDRVAGSAAVLSHGQNKQLPGRTNHHNCHHAAWQL